jgi:hypothetical protein
MMEQRRPHATITTPNSSSSSSSSSAGSDKKKQAAAFSRRMLLFVFLALLCTAINFVGQPALLASCAATRARHHQDNTPAEQKDKRYHNVLLQGHFNYERSPDIINAWVQAWSKYFSNILVVGPFSPETRSELIRLNITFRAGRADKSLHSATYEHLMLTLLEYKHDPIIDGVLYLHDDALVNLTRFTNGLYPFPTDSIVGTFPRKKGNSSTTTPLFTIHVQDDDNGDGKGGNTSPKVYYSKDGHSYDSQKTLRAQLVKWPHWKKNCLPPLTNMLLDPQNAHMFPNTGTSSRANYEIPDKFQSDILFVPTRLADAFAHHARPFIDHQVFLECAIPTIIHHMLKQEQESKNDIVAFEQQSRTVDLCTSWDYDMRTKYTTKFVEDCIEKPTENGYVVYHPVKMYTMSVNEWVSLLDSVQNTTSGK